MHNSCGQVALHCSCLCCARTDSGSRSHSRTAASSYCSFTEFLQFFKPLPLSKKHGIIQNMKGKVMHMQHFLPTRVTVVNFTVSFNTNFQLKDSDVNRDCVS